MYSILKLKTSKKIIKILIKILSEIWFKEVKTTKILIIGRIGIILKYSLYSLKFMMLNVNVKFSSCRELINEYLMSVERLLNIL